MKKLSPLIILFSLILIFSCATDHKPGPHPYISQEKLDAPIWNVEDHWKFQLSDRREWEIEVIRSESNYYVIENPRVIDFFAYNRDTLGLEYYITREGEIKKLSFTEIWFDFPLYVGKKWKKMIVAPPARNMTMNVNYFLEFECMSYEDVTVPAGTFKAMKIKYLQTNFLETSSPGLAYLWFSPEVKFIIKMVYEKKPFWIERQDWELMSFKLVEKESLPSDKLKVLPPITSPKETNIITITVTSANIHSGAGEGFPVLTTVKMWDKLIVLGEEGEWLNVRLKNGEGGWINRKFTRR